MNRSYFQNHSVNITGIGVISGAGLNASETKKTFFSNPLKPHNISVENPYIQIKTKPDWLKAFEVPEETLKVNGLALLAVQEAIDSAGLSTSDLSNLRVGICVGSTVGCSNFLTDFNHEFNLKKFPDPQILLSHFKNNTAQFLARYYKLRGPALLITNACTSGADAIGIGASWINSDLCDVVICGGTEVILPQIYAGFKSMQLCAASLCKPFDKNRKGLTLGEGAAFLVLEKKTSERRPKAKLLGYGSASDAYHSTAPHPEGRGLQRACQLIEEQSIDFINAHATATLHNDLAEGRLIHRNYPATSVVATKSYTGHALGAVGAIEAVFTIISLIEQKLPRSLGFETLDPEINLSPTTEIESNFYQNALSFSLGFGGTNSVLCFGCAE